MSCWSERRLIDRAEQVILLVDSSKFHSSSGTIVCGLNEVDIVITDSDIDQEAAEAIEKSGAKLIVAR